MENGYIAFYKNKRKEIYANSSYEAQTKAAKEFGVKPNKQYQVDVYLAEKGGETVIHSTTEI